MSLNRTQILNPYATHLPVLRALGQALSIRRVLECGAGEYSSLLFLDRVAYPVLERVDSLESDWGWLMRVKEAAQDTRLWLTYVHSLMPRSVEGLDLNRYDLILIDNGAVVAERVPVIKAVCAARPTAVVAIHDYDRPEYQGAAVFDHQRVFKQNIPWTMLGWNGSRPEVEGLTL